MRAHDISRRTFVTCGAAAALLPVAGRAKASTVPALRFGFLSEIHIGRGRASADRVYRPALEWFRDQGVEAVVCTGDLATTGLLAELKHVSDVWYEVFPDDRLPDGRHVEKVFLYGNHDTSPTVERYSVRAGRAEEFKRASILTDRAKAWEAHFREPFAPIYMKRVKGYAFVAAHWEGLAPSVTGASEYLTAHRTELAGDKPFFYCQHAPLRGTVNPFSGHFDDGKVTETLKGFPNAIALTGHSHSALTDETSIWQGDFTAVCGAACANSGRRYGNPWFENSDVPGSPEGAYPGRKGAQMPELNTSKDGGQGLLVDVYEDRIVFHRRSFIFNEPNGPDWIVPLPFPSGAPYAFATRKRSSAPPEFAPDARILLAERDGADREKNPVRQLVVSFPAAMRGARPLGYEVRVGSAEARADVVRCVLSPDFHLPPTHRVKEAECVFAVSGLPPAGRRRVSVRAFDSFRNFGRPLVAEPML